MSSGKECWGARHTLAIMAFFGLAVEYSLRVNLSIAIVAMAGTTDVPDVSNSTDDICPVKGNDTGSKNTYIVRLRCVLFTFFLMRYFYVSNYFISLSFLSCFVRFISFYLLFIDYCELIVY